MDLLNKCFPHHKFICGHFDTNSLHKETGVGCMNMKNPLCSCSGPACDPCRPLRQMQKSAKALAKAGFENQRGKEKVGLEVNPEMIFSHREAGWL